MADGSPRTAGELGEFALVDAIAARFAQGPKVRIGPGDDAAVVEVSTGAVVASVDLVLQDRHFRLDWSSAADIGHKAAARSMSDVNAMGGVTTGLLVGLGCPPDVEASWLLDLADGIAEEAGLVGASVVGGDVSTAKTIVMSMSAFGECEHGVVRRSGARVGDVVAMAGRQGWAAGGFAVLGRGFRSPRLVVEAHRRPQPPYLAGPEAARSGATAMIDVSDGLLQDLGHLATAGGVGIDVARSRFEVPEPIQAVGAALGVDPMHLVLTGGDDYCLVATFPAAATLPQAWRQIGTVVEPGGPAPVTVDGEPYPEPGGHQHFR